MTISRPILYPKNTSAVFLFGGSDTLPRLAQHLRDQGYVVHVYTSPRQAAEILQGETLAEALRRNGAPVAHITEDINADFPIELVDSNAIGIGVGEAWVFGEKIRAAFGDRLLDYMSVPLPRYRGGAHLSWAIMRGEREWGGCLQLVTDTTVPGEVHDGFLIDSWDYDVPASCRIPQHWFDFCGWEDVLQISNFLARVTAGWTFFSQPVNERGATFFPRLRTCDNGWIDWSLPCGELFRSICAFDDPYPGARTCLYEPNYGARDVALKDATWNELIAPINVPYQRGLVMRVDDDGIHIAASDGVITARKVLYHGTDYTSQVKVGRRFHTSTEQLEKALISTPIYTPKVTQ